MLKWVKNSLETKNLGSKKGGVIVMKGKTKKRSPKSSPKPSPKSGNGNPEKPSPKTSAAPVAGNPPQSTGKMGKGPPPHPSSSLPKSGGPPMSSPPISNKSKSPTAVPSCPPSMGGRSKSPEAVPPCPPSMGGRSSSPTAVPPCPPSMGGRSSSPTAVPPCPPSMGGRSSSPIAVPPCPPSMGGRSSSPTAVPPCPPSMGGRSSSPTAVPPCPPSMGGRSSSPTAVPPCPPSMGRRSNSPTTSRTAPPSNISMSKGPASQAYHESSGQSPTDYSYFDDQSDHSHEMDIAHKHGSNMKHQHQSSNSHASPSGIDHQSYEYDPHPPRNYASSPHIGGSSAHDSPSSFRGHGSPSSYDHSGPSSPHGHSGPPSSHGYSGPSSPQNYSDHSGPSSPHHNGQHSSQMYGSCPQYSKDDYNSYPQYDEGQQSLDPYSNQGYSNGSQEAYPQQLQNSYVSSPGTPKGHYNPENVERTTQVSSPLKHVSKAVPVKKPPRSPKTPISLPLRARDVPSPSIAARALKNSPIDDYTNIVKSVPSKPGPQIPYKERLPKSPKKEIFVTFPDGQMVKQFIDPNMAMMDLLIQLTASKRLNPSGYLLVALSEDGNRPVDYKANQPVGLVNSHRVKLMNKERVKSQQMSPTNEKTKEKQLPFEGYDYEIYQPGPQLVSPNQMTYRLTVNLPHSQKVVRRMSANHPLYELHQSVCEEKNLDPDIFVFQLPDRPTSQVNLKYTLQELGLVNYELNLIHRAEMDHYMSVPNLSTTGPTWMNDQSAFKPSTNATYVHMPPPGDSRKKRGFFSFLRKDKRGKSRSLSPTSFGELADTLENWMSSFFSGDLLNNSGKSRPASMFSPMTDTFESYLKKPKKSTKKKPAPPPPTGHPPATGKMPQDVYTGVPMQQQLSNCPPGGAVNSGTDQGHQTFQMHSQTKSDPNINYEQRAGADPAHQRCKIGTDSVTYVEDSDGMNNLNKLPSTPHRYLSDLHNSPVAADDRPPENIRAKNVNPINPRCLSLQLKTADDMYASPIKKRKPAPLPPPGGPQVRPKFDILSTSKSSESSSLDTPNTCNPSISNAHESNSSNPASTKHLETTNHASRTPLITIKTGPFTIENESSSTPLKEDDKDTGVENREKGNDLRVEMEQKKGTEEKLEFSDQNEGTELIVEDMSLNISSEVDTSVQIENNGSQVEISDQKEISYLGGENHNQKEISYLGGENHNQKEISYLGGENHNQKEISYLGGETVIQRADEILETPAEVAATNINYVAETSTPVDLIIGPPEEAKVTDAEIETSAEEVITDLVENTAQENKGLKEEIPSEIENSNLHVETTILSVDSDLKMGIPVKIYSTDLNIKTLAETKITDLKEETLTHGECCELNVENSFQIKGTDIVVESVDPQNRTDLKLVTPPTQTEDTDFKRETLTQEGSANYEIEPAALEKIPDFIVEKPAEEDLNLILEIPTADEGNALEKDTEEIKELVILNELDKCEVSENGVDTFQDNHIEEADIKLLRPCSFNAPPPPLTPPPAEPPTDIPSPVIIIGTEMVDKSVGISEDSTSLTANDASPHGGHSRSLSKVSTTSSIGTAEEVTSAFDETIAVAEEALQKELMEQMKNAETEGGENTNTKLIVEQLSHTPKNKKHSKGKNSPKPQIVGTVAYLAQNSDSADSSENGESPDTYISDVTLESHTPKKKHSINSISSDGSFTTIGVSDSASIHNTEADVCNIIKRETQAEQHGDDFTEIQVPIPRRFSQSSIENEKIVNGKPSVIEIERFEVNGIEVGIEKTAALTKTKIGSQVTVIRPNLETSASLELSRSSSAAELAQYMESPKDELLLTKKDRQSLDYRGSPIVEVQKKLEDVKKNREGSPKILLDGFSMSLDSESGLHSSDIEAGPQDNLKKQIERWQKQLQEHLSDNSGLYTPQEQDKLKQKVDQWNKQLKELNIMDTSGFWLLEQNVLKQQIELWQRKLLAKERQYDGRKKFQEQETEFLKRQIAVWKKKIEVIEKCENLYTTEEHDVLQQQIELWQSQLAQSDNMDIHEKEQNLLKRQIEVWKKNLKEKKFAGQTFSLQEQHILKQQLNVWQKQLQWYKTGGVSAKSEILREQVDVWQLQLLDVQKNPSEDSKIEQGILEQQIELWQCKLNQKDILSEDIMLKQIDIWKRQTDTNRTVDDKYIVQEQMIIEKEIQLWNKRLSGEDVECENFIALEQDLLHEKIELCQQKLKNNVEIDSPDMLLEQEMLKLQVDLWQQKLSAMQEKKLAMINYKQEEQDILKFQIKLWEDKLIHPSEKNSAVAISEKGTELLAKEVDLWQRWLNVKKEKKEACIKFKFLDEEMQKEQIRLWQDHLNVIKNDVLGYTEEEREILMEQIELWQKGLTEKKDGKTMHLAAEQDILKKYIDLWYNKMRRNTAGNISEERDDVRKQIEIWKKQLNMYTLDDNPLPHSARQDIINQQITIWQKKHERCSVDADELTKIESEILQQQIELWQTDLIEYEQRKGSADKEMPKEQIKLLKRTLSQRKADTDPEILAQEKAIVNRQIDLYQKKLENGHEPDSSDFINDEQKILEQQIDLWHRKLCLPDEGKAFYSESEYDILQKQVSLWHQQLVAIQHRQESLRKIAMQEQNLLKEQINLWEMKLEAFPDPVFLVEEQDAMKDQIELWQQQLEEHKSIILNKTASTPDDPELRKMELMLRSQEEIIQSFKEGLKNLPENLKTRTSSPSVLPPPIPVKVSKPVQKVPIVEFPPPPETFSDKEDFTALKLKQTVPKAPPKPPTPPPLSHALASLKRVDPSERPTSPVKDNNEEVSVQRAVPAVVLKPAVARKPKRKLPEPVLSPREELMMEIKNFTGRTKLKGVKLKDTKWSGASFS